MTRIYHGFVDDAGKLGMDDRAGFKLAIDRLRGQEVDVTIRRRRYGRSLKANAYYWGVVLTTLADFCGYETDELHECLAMRFLRIEDCRITGVPRRKSTRDLNTEEFARYLDQCIRFAAELGVVVPEATSVEAA